MDESDHLTLVNAGDEEVVSQEEGGREGSAAGGEEGGCCCASAIAIAHMRAHRARENSTRLGRVHLSSAPGVLGAVPAVDIDAIKKVSASNATDQDPASPATGAGSDDYGP